MLCVLRGSLGCCATLYGLADSPVGLAAWLLDHGDGWGQPAAPVTSVVLGHTSRGHPAGDLTRDDVLDNITLYWLTNAGVSSARLYWENKLSLYNDADVSDELCARASTRYDHTALWTLTVAMCFEVLRTRWAGPTRP